MSLYKGELILQTIYVKISKCHDHEAKPTKVTKKWRDEEQITTTQTSHMKPQTHKEKIIEKTTRVWVCGWMCVGVGGEAGLNQFY